MQLNKQLTKGSSNPAPINPYYAAAEKAVAAQRPFQPRKKPVKRAAGTQSWASSDQAFTMGQWMSPGRRTASGEELRLDGSTD